MKIFLVLLCFLIGFYIPMKGGESFLILSGNTNRVIQEFGSNIYKRVTPASTFKIALSLIGFDAGILKTEIRPIWSFQEGYDDFLLSWEASQSPQTWIAQSCIWYSKIISCKLGLEKLQYYLSLIDYGNQNLSLGLIEPGPLNPAWVSSSLKISPKEQVELIRKMVLGILPVSSHACEMTKLILFKEELSERWKLYGKTGLGTVFENNGDSQQVRWFVGWIEKGDIFFPFAYQICGKRIDVNQTLPRVKRLLLESRIMNL